jgi:hypothetical protein
MPRILSPIDGSSFNEAAILHRYRPVSFRRCTRGYETGGFRVALKERESYWSSKTGIYRVVHGMSWDTPADAWESERWCPPAQASHATSDDQMGFRVVRRHSRLRPQ